VKERPLDVPLDFPVFQVELAQKFLDVLSPGAAGGGAAVFAHRQFQQGSRPFYLFFLCQGQRAYQGNQALEHFLPWKHGAHFSTEKHVHEKGLHEIVNVMTKGNLVAGQGTRELKKPLPPPEGTDKARALAPV